jgi:hypothetical protein
MVRIFVCLVGLFWDLCFFSFFWKWEGKLFQSPYKLLSCESIILGQNNLLKNKILTQYQRRKYVTFSITFKGERGYTRCGGTCLQSQHSGAWGKRITSLRLPWTKYWVPGWPQIHGETLFPKKLKRKRWRKRRKSWRRLLHPGQILLKWEDLSIIDALDIDLDFLYTNIFDMLLCI